jgi:light-regulated signal transduction histidine kinase (bacteriophytochrome)
MQNLINDLLAYSRVGTRGQPFAPTDCNEVVRRVLTNLKLKIAETGAQVICAGLPTVMADASQLTQLFQNLINNALKYRGAEAPRITIEAELKDREWLFSVQDNGIGIEPRYFERIFVIFQRLHSASEHSGTGIGLAVCKKIVERHNGIIWVGSVPGEGSTFYFSMPALQAEA